MSISEQDIYNRISHLLKNVPDKLDKYSCVVEWCAKADVLVEFLQNEAEDDCIANGIYDVQEGINQGHLSNIKEGVTAIRTSLIRCLYRLELSGRVHSTSSFIPAGNEFDALNAITNVFSRANMEILLVDPYLDEVAFKDFLSFAPNKVKIQILCSSKKMEEKIGAPLKRWKSQNPEREIVVRSQHASKLHDRIIVLDRQLVFLISQSLNGIGKRSHAYIVEADTELSKLKVEAYGSLWEDGSTFKS